MLKMNDNFYGVKNVGNGEPVSNGIFRRTYLFKSLVAGKGIKLQSTPDTIVISQDANILNGLLTGIHKNITFEEDVEITMATGSVFENCIFNGKATILGYGKIKNCVFNKPATLGVHTIKYTKPIKFIENVTFQATYIMLKTCLIEKINNIDCKYFTMKNASIKTNLLVLHATSIEVINSNISADKVHINSTYFNCESFTAPFFDVREELKLQSSDIDLGGHLCKTQNTMITCNSLEGEGSIESINLTINGNINGSLAINVKSLELFSSSIKGDNHNWNISNDVFISAKFMYSSNSIIKLTKCNGMITIDKLFGSTLFDIYGESDITVGGNWSTTDDHLIRLEKYSKLKLLPSIFASARCPFSAVDPTQIMSLPSLVSKQSPYVFSKQSNMIVI